jgi:hypothetical protein
MPKNAYTQLCEEIAQKVNDNGKAKGKSSCSVSRIDLENIASTLINTPDHSVDVYQYSSRDTTGVGDPKPMTKTPSARYRNSLKPVLHSLGLDKHDADKIDDVAFPREHAAALMDVATTVIHDYMKAGRKFAFPITSKDETRMEISCAVAPEKISINRFNKDSSEDSTTVTAERTILKSKNPVPYWLKGKK